VNGADRFRLGNLFSHFLAVSIQGAGSGNGWPRGRPFHESAWNGCLAVCIVCLSVPEFYSASSAECTRRIARDSKKTATPNLEFDRGLDSNPLRPTPLPASI